MTKRSIIYATFVLVLPLSSLAADEFILASGGRVEGELLNPDESPRQSYLLQTADGGKLKLAAQQVERVVTKSDPIKRYEAFVATLPDTIESHMDAARRCERAGLTTQRTYHLEQVLRLDPDHDDARHELGYNRLDGAWVRADDFMRNKGYVRFGNAWRLPQEVELATAADAIDKQVTEWRKKIKRWREWVVKGSDQALDGRTELVRIRDPIAIPVLIESLTRDKDPPAMRLLYVEALGAMGTPEVLATFVRLTLFDRDPEIREACLDWLAKSGSKGAVRQFIKALKHEQNLIVKRAATALERMNDPEATLPLIEALVTEHKSVVGGNQMTPSFSGTGDASFSAGGSQKIIRYPVNNEPALRALATLNVGVNFGFDQARWRAWYIEMNRPKSVASLRRGP